MEAREFLAASSDAKLVEAERLIKIGRKLINGAGINDEYLSRLSTCAAGIAHLTLIEGLKRVQAKQKKDRVLIDRLVKSIAALEGIDDHDAFEGTVFTGVMIGVALAIEFELR